LHIQNYFIHAEDVGQIWRWYGTSPNLHDLEEALMTAT